VVELSAIFTATLFKVPLGRIRPAKAFLTIWTREWAAVVCSIVGSILI